MSSLANPTTCIENLPPEMICAVFEHLPPKDLAACSMVNKRWHSIHASFKLHRLVVTDYNPEFNFIKWQGSNEPIQEAEQCRSAMFLRLAEKPLLSKLKHLALSGYPFEFDFNELNRFQQLVHLEIYVASSSGEMHLNLPSLKVLAIHYNDHCALSVDCPELSTLLYFGEDANLEVKHPETIRKLTTGMVGAKLAKFKSVECLVTNQFEAISMGTLLALPRLRELHYNKDIKKEHWYYPSEIGTIDRMKRTVSEFVDEVKKLRGSDFQFTFFGFQLANVNVDQIDFGVCTDEFGRERVHNKCIYMKNYHLIEPGALHFIVRVDYTQLLNSVTGEIPRCFFQKFTGIKEVEVHDVVKDPDHLLWFLKSLRFLRRLRLVFAELNQEFYDQLPAAARSLVSLKVEDWMTESELQLNFDFMGEFTILSKLEIRQALSLNSATSIVRWLGGVKEASIRVRTGRDLWIEKESDSTVWKIQRSVLPTRDSHLFETENPGELGIFLAGFQAALLETSI